MQVIKSEGVATDLSCHLVSKYVYSIYKIDIIVEKIINFNKKFTFVEVYVIFNFVKGGFSP